MVVVRGWTVLMTVLQLRGSLHGSLRYGTNTPPLHATRSWPRFPGLYTVYRTRTVRLYRAISANANL